MMFGVKQIEFLINHKGNIMSTYTKELQDEVERVTMKGSADKQTIRRLASIIFRMDQRIIALEGGISFEKGKDDEEKQEVKTPEVVQKKTIRPVQAKSEDLKAKDESKESE